MDLVGDMRVREEVKRTPRFGKQMTLRVCVGPVSEFVPGIALVTLTSISCWGVLLVVFWHPALPFHTSLHLTMLPLLPQSLLCPQPPGLLLLNH